MPDNVIVAGLAACAIIDKAVSIEAALKKIQAKPVQKNVISKDKGLAILVV